MFISGTHHTCHERDADPLSLAPRPSETIAAFLSLPVHLGAGMGLSSSRQQMLSQPEPSTWWAPAYCTLYLGPGGSSGACLLCSSGSSWCGALPALLGVVLKLCACGGGGRE